MKPLDMIFIGAGERGSVYANYVAKHPQEARAVAVADPNPVRRQRFAETHAIPINGQYNSWEDVLAGPRLAPVCVISTMDRLHYEPARRALERGYHVLLEKPMSPDPLECLELADVAEWHNRVLTICHVLRYAPFFTTLKQLLDEGRIGRLTTIQYNENIGYWHFAHSYVRGNWRRSDQAGPIVLSKSCHDTDMLRWLAGDRCVRLASFGSLNHFRAENAPEGSTQRCLDGCAVEATCPYSARKIYLDWGSDWLWSIVTDDKTPEGRLKALSEGPYGRCVFHSDNDVVDHQVINMEFANGVTAAFTLSAFTSDISRTMKLMGTEGEIRAHFNRSQIEIYRFNGGRTDTIQLQPDHMGHGGGEAGLMSSFIRLVQEGHTDGGLTSARISAETHLIAFAAEEARRTRTVIDLAKFEERLRSEAQAKSA